MSRVAVVFGARDLVGSSVAVALTSKSFKVRGVTLAAKDDSGCRSADSKLRDAGVEMVATDLSDKASIQSTLHGAEVAFIQTSSTQGREAEVLEGRLIAEACNAERVPHVIYCTQLSVVRVLGMAARHMDAKAEVENYMRHDLDLPLTSVIIPCLYDDLFKPPLAPRQRNGQARQYGFAIPMGQTPLNMMCAQDVGPVIAQIASQPRLYLDKTVSLCAAKLTIKEVAAITSKQLAPVEFKDTQITVKQFRELSFSGAEDLANMFDFFVRVDQKASIENTQSLYPALQSMDQWISAHKDMLLQSLDDPQSGSQTTPCLPFAL